MKFRETTDFSPFMRHFWGWYASAAPFSDTERADYFTNVCAVRSFLLVFFSVRGIISKFSWYFKISPRWLWTKLWKIHVCQCTCIVLTVRVWEDSWETRRFYKHLHENLPVQLSVKEVSCSNNGNFKEVHASKAGTETSLYLDRLVRYVLRWVYPSVFPKNSSGTADCSFPRACLLATCTHSHFFRLFHLKSEPIACQQAKRRKQELISEVFLLSVSKQR